MTALSINLNKIALIRNSRPGNFPSVTVHAEHCIEAGADGITIHPRPDQRHIRATDATDLADILSVELNIEGNPFAGPCPSDRADVANYPRFMELVLSICPAQCTLVPDTSSQLTSDHGFDLRTDGDRLAPLIDKLKSAGVRVSLFMDPDVEQIRLAAEIGADRVELYTGPDAACYDDPIARQASLAMYSAASKTAGELGLGVNAGHDLNLDNLQSFERAVDNLLEVSIGHAFTVDALQLGLVNTVAAYQARLGKPRNP